MYWDKGLLRWPNLRKAWTDQDSSVTGIQNDDSNKYLPSAYSVPGTYCSKHLPSSHLGLAPNFINSYYFPISQMRKPEPRKVKYIVQDHTTSNFWSQDVNPWHFGSIAWALTHYFPLTLGCNPIASWGCQNLVSLYCCLADTEESVLVLSKQWQGKWTSLVSGLLFILFSAWHTPTGPSRPWKKYLLPHLWSLSLSHRQS